MDALSEILHSVKLEGAVFYNASSQRRGAFARRLRPKWRLFFAMECDRELCRTFLGGLPPVFKVNIRNDQAGQWLENSIKFSAAEASANRAGSDAVLARLSEALFVETMRRYMAELPPQQTGWLAGARDPGVGAALASMHRSPEYPWTIANLAQRVGVSRSVLAERFRHFLGEPPMTYLSRWRLQLGARMLTSTSYSVARISGDVGYESEPAFNRAFKREFGAPPARFRMRAKSAKRVVRLERGQTDINPSSPIKWIAPDELSQTDC